MFSFGIYKLLFLFCLCTYVYIFLCIIIVVYIACIIFIQHTMYTILYSVRSTVSIYRIYNEVNVLIVIHVQSICIWFTESSFIWDSGP